MGAQRFAMYSRIGLPPDLCEDRAESFALVRGSLSIFSDREDACPLVNLSSANLTAAEQMQMLENAMKRTLVLSLADMLMSTAIVVSVMVVLHSTALLAWDRFFDGQHLRSRSAAPLTATRLGSTSSTAPRTASSISIVSHEPSRKASDIAAQIASEIASKMKAQERSRPQAGDSPADVAVDGAPSPS
eukprot:988981-Prymnesium_polylepis.1